VLTPTRQPHDGRALCSRMCQRCALGDACSKHKVDAAGCLLGSGSRSAMRCDYTAVHTACETSAMSGGAHRCVLTIHTVRPALLCMAACPYICLKLLTQLHQLFSACSSSTTTHFSTRVTQVKHNVSSTRRTVRSAQESALFD
jgi:hypothetical protein